MSGSTLLLDVNLSDTVAELKNMIYEASGIQPEVQTLIYDLKQLKNEQTLASCNILSESTIKFIARVKFGEYVPYKRTIEVKDGVLSISQPSYEEARDYVSNQQGMWAEAGPMPPAYGSSSSSSSSEQTPPAYSADSSSSSSSSSSEQEVPPAYGSSNTTPSNSGMFSQSGERIAREHKRDDNSKDKNIPGKK